MGHPAVDMRDLLEGWMKDAMDRAQANALNHSGNAGERLKYMDTVLRRINIAVREVMDGIDQVLEVEKLLAGKR